MRAERRTTNNKSRLRMSFLEFISAVPEYIMRNVMVKGEFVAILHRILYPSGVPIVGGSHGIEGCYGESQESSGL